MSDRDVIAEPACRRRAMLLSLLFAILLGTGLHLEFLAARNWNSGEIVLWAHIVVGLGFLVAFLPWIGRHVARGLDHSQRPFFVWISWLLLATYQAVEEVSRLALRTASSPL